MKPDTSYALPSPCSDPQCSISSSYWGWRGRPVTEHPAEASRDWRHWSMLSAGTGADAHALHQHLSPGAAGWPLCRFFPCGHMVGSIPRKAPDCGPYGSAGTSGDDMLRMHSDKQDALFHLSRAQYIRFPQNQYHFCSVLRFLILWPQCCTVHPPVQGPSHAGSCTVFFPVPHHCMVS